MANQDVSGHADRLQLVLTSVLHDINNFLSLADLQGHQLELENFQNPRPGNKQLVTALTKIQLFRQPGILKFQFPSLLDYSTVKLDSQKNKFIALIFIILELVSSSQG